MAKAPEASGMLPGQPPSGPPSSENAQVAVATPQKVAFSTAAADKPISSGGLFKEVNALRDSNKKGAGEEAREARRRPTVLDKYKKEGKVAALAKNRYFEYTTLFIISLNGIWIGVDTDHNTVSDPKDTLLIFKVADQFFCIYFTFEVIVRFIAFAKKSDCLKDAWFVFDSVLVSLMILETWLMPLIALLSNDDGGGSGMGNLSILRLLRLLRLTRMARLMRAVPTLLTLIKGIVAATRSVGATLALLIVFTYVFAIIFTGQYRERQGEVVLVPRLGDPGEPGEVELWEYFGTMPRSIFTLAVNGTLLDDLTTVVYALLEDSQIMVWVLIIFILISSFTVLNMLIGILCEVVTATKEGEKKKAAETQVRDVLESVFDEIDHDRNGTVSQVEYESMTQNQQVLAAFQELGIEQKQLKQLKNVLFVPDRADGKGAQVPEELSFSDFMEGLLNLRPNMSASVLDVENLRKTMRDNTKCIEQQMELARLQLDVIQAKYSKGSARPSPVSFDGSHNGAVVPAPPSADKGGMLDASQILAQASDADILAELCRRLPDSEVPQI